MPCPTIDHPIDTTKCEEIGPGIVAQKHRSSFKSCDKTIAYPSAIQSRIKDRPRRLRRDPPTVAQKPSPGDVNRKRSNEHRKLIQVEGIEEIDDEDGEHDRSAGQRHHSGGEEPTCRPKNRSRSRFLEAGANKFITMSRRSQRRHMWTSRSTFF
ncbi:hypothetical protein V3C99_002724 [Haemonchus contortus]